MTYETICKLFTKARCLSVATVAWRVLGFLDYLLLFVSRQKVKEGKFEKIIFSQEMSKRRL